MRLRLLDRVRRSRWRRADRSRSRDQTDPATGPSTTSGPAARPGSGVLPRSGAAPRSGGASGTVGAHRRAGRAGGDRSGPRGVGGSQAGSPGTRASGPASPWPPSAGGQTASDLAQAEGRAGPGAAAQGTTGPGAKRPGASGQAAGHALPRRWGGLARAATRAAPRARTAAETVAAAKPGRGARGEARTPWYEIAQRNRTALGRRHCGHIEEIVHREWAEGVTPPPEVVRAVDRLAELPHLIKVKLRAGLDAIHVGAGGVPDLDDMGQLHGIPLPSGRATWDACAGAYGERKIIVGSRPSPTPDVMCHEIGHALDDLDGAGEQWQSDSAEFQSLYSLCLPRMASAFHRQPGLLGRREFYADAFAAIASRQRPALVEMLSGDTRAALNVMLYFNVRYGI